MSTAEALRGLLEPLGVYAWGEGSLQKAELSCVGAATDGALEVLDHLAREMLVCTAEDEGLERICSLLAKRPASTTTAQLQAALAALLRIGDASFTKGAIGNNISGCGIPATVTETSVPGQVEIHFPGTPGMPHNFALVQTIIEDILPAHLELLYVFWYITWARLQTRLPTWAALHAKRLTWAQLEVFVQD